MVERIKSRKGVGQKPKYLLFLEALNRIYRTLQSDSVTVIKIVINADYLGFFLISYNGFGLGEGGLVKCSNLAGCFCPL
jgi:hypothetical protein